MENKVEGTRTNLVEKISLKEKISYGCGDLASNLILALTSTLIVYFYSNVVGIAMGTVATIMLISRIFDGLTDIGMGIIVDKVNSKHGKARSWILWLAIPFSLSAILLIAIPAGLPMNAKVVYAFVTYNLVTTVLYTAINIPYGLLNSLMTRDQYQRSVVNIFRMTMAQVGSLVITSVTLPFINSLGGKQDAWIKVTIVYAIITTILFFVCFRNTKERVTMTSGAAAKDNIPLGVSVKVLLKNNYWLLVVLVWVVMMLGISLSGTVSTYYAQYIIGNNNYMSAFNAASTVPMLVGIPLMTPLIKKWGKRNIAMIGSLIGAAGCTLMLLAPANVTVLIIGNVIQGIGRASISGTIFAMVADTIEYGEWKTGVRVQALLYSATTFGSKVGVGVGSAVAGYVLQYVGFNAAMAQQNAAVIGALKGMYIVVPIVIGILEAVCFYFYKLDKSYDQIIADLQLREQQTN